ncbi:MAG: hypothetical protein AAF826_11810 [Pseudomonadota bacterium]
MKELLAILLILFGHTAKADPNISFIRPAWSEPSATALSTGGKPMLFLEGRASDQITQSDKAILPEGTALGFGLSNEGHWDGLKSIRLAPRVEFHLRF